MKNLGLLIVIFGFIQITCSAFTSNPEFSYIFAPGMLSTETQLAKYIPKFLASTDEIVTCSNGINVICEPVTVCNFAEINLKPLINNSFNILNKAAYYLSHLSNCSYGIKVNVSENKQATHTVGAQSINIFNINIAQDKDIECLYNTYHRHCDMYADSDIIAYGVSRGAAATFNFLSQYKPERVKAAVLEGVFDSLSHVIDKKFWFAPNLAKILLSKITSYNQHGINPIDNVAKISKELPILLVTSLKDADVPYQCTINLYCNLLDAGHKKVHILILKNSSHPGYIFDDAKDKKDYESVVHSFYAHYDLPHDPDLAKLGLKRWSDCSPDTLSFKSKALNI